jgi:hypothetical protein
MAGPETSSGVRRCPSCGARNRGTGPWCTLCHADLSGPPPPTLAESLADLVAGDDVDDGVTDDGRADDGPAGAVRPGPASAEVDPAVAEQVLEQLLVQLRAQESGIRLPGRWAAFGGLLRPGASRGATIAFGLGVMVAVTVVVVTVLAVVGLAL